MAFPVRTRARREKSEWRSAGFSNTRWYSSNYNHRRRRQPEASPRRRGRGGPAEGTSLGRLLLEKTLRGQDRWRCLEIQLLMLSQSTVPLGGGPSSRCSSTSCFWARTALPSNMRSSCRPRAGALTLGPECPSLLSHFNMIQNKTDYKKESLRAAMTASGPSWHCSSPLCILLNQDTGPTSPRPPVLLKAFTSSCHHQDRPLLPPQH